MPRWMRIENRLPVGEADDTSTDVGVDAANEEREKSGDGPGREHATGQGTWLRAKERRREERVPSCERDTRTEDPTTISTSPPAVRTTRGVGIAPAVSEGGTMRGAGTRL